MYCASGCGKSVGEKVREEIFWHLCGCRQYRIPFYRHLYIWCHGKRPKLHNNSTPMEAFKKMRIKVRLPHPQMSLQMENKGKTMAMLACLKNQFQMWKLVLKLPPLPTLMYVHFTLAQSVSDTLSLSLSLTFSLRPFMNYQSMFQYYSEKKR